LSSFEELFQFVGRYALVLDDNDLRCLECVLELANFKRQGLNLEALLKDQLPQRSELFIGHASVVTHSKKVGNAR
jgi:hypothetical protein